ncbi:MAG TPA: Ger(x)C family spore germination protein, partial [Ruminococcaceae bacterium]|nr:Ger(x)C family spore germination protein [Oscillospiraceae bacterium]
MIDEKNPKQWDSMKNNWEQIYKKIKPSITVQVQVSDPGQINQFKK